MTHSDLDALHAATLNLLDAMTWLCGRAMLAQHITSPDDSVAYFCRVVRESIDAVGQHALEETVTVAPQVVDWGALTSPSACTWVYDFASQIAGAIKQASGLNVIVRGGELEPDAAARSQIVERWKIIAPAIQALATYPPDRVRAEVDRECIGAKAKLPRRTPLIIPTPSPQFAPAIVPASASVLTGNGAATPSPTPAASPAPSQPATPEPSGAATPDDEKNVSDSSEQEDGNADAINAESLTLAMLPEVSTARDLAARLEVSEGAVDAFLRDFARRNPFCRIVDDDAPKNMVRTIYRTKEVWAALQERLPKWQAKSDKGRTKK